MTAPTPAAPSTPGSLLTDKIPPTLHQALRDWLDDEPLLACTPTASKPDKTNNSPWHLVLSPTKSGLLTLEDGEHARWRDLPTPATLTIETSPVGRDRFLQNDHLLFEGPRLGAQPLRETAQLANLAPLGRLLHLAELHHKQQLHTEAAEILADAEDYLLPQDHHPQSPGATPQLHMLHLLRARTEHHLGRPARAIGSLVALALLRSYDDLLELSEELELDQPDWLLLLALAQEEAEHHAHAARVFEELAKRQPAQQLHVLQQARCLARADEIEAALQQYRAFLDARLRQTEREDPFAWLHESQPDEAHYDCDPDLAAAFGELGALLEAQNQAAQAAQIYLELVRHAPLFIRGYQQLFALQEALPQSQHPLLQQVAEALRLLDPALVEKLADDDGIELPPPPATIALPNAYPGQLNEESHEEHLRHPGERHGSSAVQRWLGSMVQEPPDTAAIEAHCRRVTEVDYPVLFALTENVAQMLAIEPPRVYLSYGKRGIQVMGAEREPFVLMSVQHIEENNAQKLNTRQLAFALGSQLEHIRAKHLVLTNSEFWSAFGDKAFEGVFSVIGLFPAGSVISKLADSWVTKLVTGAKSSWENKTLRNLLADTDRSIRQLGPRSLQGPYRHTLGRVLAPQRDDAESMVKEQLADFARSALYTADRLGLLACDSLPDALGAIISLSPSADEQHLIPAIEARGLRALLEAEQPHSELRLRLAELLKFALSEEYFTLRQQLITPTQQGQHDAETIDQ